MTDTFQIIIFILILIMAFIISRRFLSWKMMTSYKFIINDLREKKAFDQESAVLLSYAQRSMMRIGLRDYRPRMLVQLVLNGTIGVTDDGRYYLKKTDLMYMDN